MSLSRQPARERIPAAILALGLQAVFLALLLYSFPLTAPARHAVHESILLLPRLIQPREPAAPRAIATQRPSRPTPAPSIFLPPPSVALPGAAAPSPDVQSLGRSLFNCAPEAYANLSPEDRARCARPGEGLAAAEPPDLMGSRSHVKDEAHWQEELAREQSQTLLPCLGGLDVLCVLKTVATGDFSRVTDPRQWPRYAVRQIPPEDFYKIEQAYDAWHKAHREPASRAAQ